MTQRILVTGGAGFIGSHVVDKLLDAGQHPVIIDMVESQPHDDTIEAYVGELCNLDALTDAMLGCDVVMHLVAVADVSQVVLDPIFAEAVNARGTLTCRTPRGRGSAGRIRIDDLGLRRLGRRGRRGCEPAVAQAPLHGDEDRREHRAWP
jgi:UDP-glucose 4-epimerase